MTAPEPLPPPDPLADREARFTALFESTHRALLAYAVRRVTEPADAADVVAESFLVAWRRIDDVPGGDDARPWMFGVARRVLANARRGDHRRLALADRLRDHLTDVVPPSGDAGSDVERAVARLSDDAGGGDRGASARVDITIGGLAQVMVYGPTTVG